MPPFPDVRLRQAGVSAARVTAIQATYNAWRPEDQARFRRSVAARTDEELRRAYDPAGVPDAAATPAQVAADPALLTAVQTAIASAHDSDAERETFTPARLSDTNLRALPFLPSADPAALLTSPDGVSQSGLWTVARAYAMRPPSKVISRFASGHAWTGGTDDLTTKLYGDRSYRGVSNGAGGSLYLSAPATGLFATPQDWSTSAIRVVVMIDDPTKMQTFQVNVTTGAGNSAAASVPGTQIAGEWGVFTVPRATFAVTGGTLNWAGVTGVNVRFQDKGNAAPITVRVAAVELIPDLGATYPNGVFIMEADDGYAGQFTNLLPVVSARGVPVTYNIISARFTGGPTPSGYTPADLRRAQDKYGWQVSCHAYAQADHDGPSTAGQMEASFQRQKHWLHANGLHAGVDHLALCPGTGSPVPEGPMMDAIRRSFRSARVNAGFYETAAPGDSLRLRSILFSGAGNSVANLQTNINAVAGAGGALIFTVHDILAGATDGTSNSLPAQAATNLATVLDYAASKGMTFRTRADWLDGR